MSKLTTLVLGIKEDKSFYLNDIRVTVTGVPTDRSFVVSVGGENIPVVGSQPIPLGMTPEVFLMVGPGTHRTSMHRKGTAKVVIQAPKEVTILREDLYLKGFDERNHSKEVPGTA